MTSQAIFLAVVLAVCRGAAGGVVPVAAPYAAYARPYGLASPLVARPAYAAPLLARPALAAPLVAHGAIAAPVDEYDPNPQYSYAYDIQDAITGELFTFILTNTLVIRQCLPKNKVRRRKIFR